jgi:hypothetical protein
MTLIAPSARRGSLRCARLTLIPWGIKRIIRRHLRRVPVFTAAPISIFPARRYGAPPLPNLRPRNSPAMTVLHETPEQDAIATFIAKHGVVRCPPAYAAPSQHSERSPNRTFRRCAGTGRRDDGGGSRRNSRWRSFDATGVAAAGPGVDTGPACDMRAIPRGAREVPPRIIGRG